MNFLKEILDRIDFERLINEGKDPSEILHYKYQQVPSNVIDQIISIDPTKKKSYSQWLLSKWDSEKNTILNNLENGRIEKMFQHYKAHDDVQIKNCPSVAAGLRFVPEEDTVLSKSDEPMTYVENLDREVDSDLANDFDIVFDDDNWKIAVPNTYEAECKLGENMRWCTANAFGNGESYYNDYLSRGGKYYVNFDMTKGESRGGKDYPFTRYQFHFESKQFMDKNDDPVSLDKIDIPQSAIDFYESEGYDASDFEDLEGKMERYNGQRYHVSYTLNDDLMLSIEYDDDYEFIEPDDHTSFYVFDFNDDRDPISWDEVPNPHTHENIVILNKEDYIILQTTFSDEDDNDYLLVTKDHQHRYREWSAYPIEKYIELPDNAGIFAVSRGNNNQRQYVISQTNGTEVYNEIGFNNCEKIFVNQYCTEADKGEWNRIFIETIQDGYHSLFTLDPENNFNCIVRKDTPRNEECYVINEYGAIEGVYGRYRAFDTDEDDGQEYTQYQLEGELENGDYIVIMTDKTQEEPKTYQNIIKKGEREPLLQQWVDKVIGFASNLYTVEKDEQRAFFNTQGQQVGDWYNLTGILDKELGIAAGKIVIAHEPMQFDLIDTNTQQVFAQFKNVLTNYQRDHKIVVQPFQNVNEGMPLVYDYAERDFAYPQFDYLKRLKSYHDTNFIGIIKNSEEKVIFNFKTQQIVSNNISTIDIVRHSDYYKLVKLNGKQNLFDDVNSTELLPFDVDEIRSVEDYRKVVIFNNNNKFFIYNFKEQQYLLNTNGFDCNVTIDEHGYYIFFNDNYAVRYYIGLNDLQFKGWYDRLYSSKNYGYNIDQNTPQEVINLCNHVTQQTTQQVTEQFNKFFERINKLF